MAAPPPSFQRSPSQKVPYGPFDTILVPALGASVDQGFPTGLPASSPAQPHPFSTHDIMEDDWLHFLSDVRQAGWQQAQSGGSYDGGGLRGRGRRNGIISGLVNDIVKSVGPGSQDPVTLMLNQWNQYFWNPRSMSVFISYPEPQDSGRRGGLISTAIGAATSAMSKAKAKQLCLVISFKPSRQ